MYAEQLEKLIALQELDLEIADLQEKLAVFPEKMKKWQQELSKQEEQLNLMRKEHQRLKVTRREREGELRAIEEEISRLQKILDQVKTNREYTSVLNEIQAVKDKQSVMENTVLELMEKDDQLTSEEKEYLSSLEKLKKEIQEKEEDDQKQAAKLKSLLEEKQSLRKMKIQEIESGLLALYERIRKRKKDGIAVCRLVVDGESASCSGCSVFVPVYVVEKVKRKAEVAHCENCSRILY